MCRGARPRATLRGGTQNSSAGDPAAGPDHPRELAERGRRIVDVAEEIGEGEVVELAVGEWQRLGLALDQLDAVGERRSPASFARARSSIAALWSIPTTRHP